MLDRLTIERIEAEAGAGPILIALSGGGDSVALLRLLAARFPSERLRAAVVDHALREGSARDALRAKAFAADCGVASEVLTLSWAADRSRSQESARTGRYAALCGAARNASVRVIVAAHTADDQAETVLMRAAGGSGWRGLAGIAPFTSAPSWPAGRCLWLARPLLQARRSALRAFLDAKGAAWIEDPANTNVAYERVRARLRLGELEVAGFDPMRLANLAARLRVRADKIDAAASALIAAAVDFEGERACIKRAAWRGDTTVRRRALAVLVVAAGGADREPGAAQVERLDVALMQEDFRGASLGGAQIGPYGGDKIALTRDTGALTGRTDGAPPLPPLMLEQAVETVWDNRLALIAPSAGWSVFAGTGRPVLHRLDQRMSAETLVERGAAQWLLQRRVTHLLGQQH